MNTTDTPTPESKILYTVYEIVLLGKVATLERELAAKEAELAEERKECMEQARLNGKGGERETKLLGELAEKDKELATLRTRVQAAEGIVRMVEAYSNALFDGPENLSSRRNDELEEMAKLALAAFRATEGRVG